ncbi:MAG: DNA-directed RNA polymerase subunit alpha [Patescibacteria group bacterium]|nr:DNA-directed RNA polymerase subunit alpha [Patescibacteria group bacterium]
MHYLQEEIGAPKVLVDKVSDNKAVFTVNPLPPGFGMTLGNAFRRVLLSSIPGHAITSVKITGVTHEYQTVEGIKDSILDIILNLKSVVVSSESDEKMIAHIDVSGRAGDVTAADIVCPEGLEVINKDAYITSLADKKTSFQVELVVEKGVGYSPAPENTTEEEGAIAIDAIFSPIKVVSWDVANTRVGQRINLDKLEVVVESDGSYDPHAAFRYASNMIKYYFGLFDASMDEDIEELIRTSIMGDIVSEQEVKEEESYTPIEILALSPRTLNALINGGIDSIEKLEKSTRKQLADLKGFGKKAMDEIIDALHAAGRKLGDEL